MIIYPGKSAETPLKLRPFHDTLNNNNNLLIT